MKRCLILLELLIALSLIAVLLTFLFRFMVNNAQVQTKVETARAYLYPREQLQTRLSSLFTSLVPRSFLNMPSFYTLEEGGIAAIFDNGIDPDPAFSGPIRSALTLEKGSLILTLFPLEEETPKRREQLLSQVEAVHFQFLAKRDSQHPSPHAVPIGRTAEWRTVWPRESWDLPALIRMTLKQQEGDLAFAFPLPVSEPAIIYGEKNLFK
jgi:hypothetical protein